MYQNKVNSSLVSNCKILHTINSLPKSRCVGTSSQKRPLFFFSRCKKALNLHILGGCLMRVQLNTVKSVHNGHPWQMARWPLYTDQLCRKYKATDNFGKLSSDRNINIQGDHYIRGHYIQVWLYSKVKCNKINDGLGGWWILRTDWFEHWQSNCARH